MFGKILLTVAVVAIVWCGFKYLGRLAELKHRAGANSNPNPVPDGNGARPAAAEAESLVECRVCGTWQSARGARSCGRPDCPY